jgi:hypothetical protein
VVQKYHVVVQYCQIGNFQSGTFAPMHGNEKCFNKKASISSIVKVPFSKNIHGMTQCPPNPEFTSIKVQKVDFLKKPSVGNIFFTSLMFA